VSSGSGWATLDRAPRRQGPCATFADRLPWPSFVPCRSGFTLLEVVVSLAIMAVGLVAVLEAFSAASRLSLQDEYITTATRLAQSKMEEVEKEPTITTGSQEGGFGDEFPDYSWSVEIQDSPVDGLETVTVTVSWEGRGGQKDYLTLIGALPAREASGSTTGSTGGQS
jgi:prepilin-type N-terminal cleavage/methylation domain-containing protein